MFAAVVGFPIEHSRSPQLHAAAYRWLGRAELVYGRIAVDVPDWASTLRRCATDADLRGLSVTMPLKSLAAQYGSPGDQHVVDLGIANTVVWDQARQPTVYNTDVYGICAALAHSLTDAPRVEVRGGDVAAFGGYRAAASSQSLVIGAGATARSALKAFAQLGWQEVQVVARRAEQAAALRNWAATIHVDCRLHDWSALPAVVRRCDVVISTVPSAAIDMATMGQPRVNQPADESALPATLLEVAYEPWPTALGRWWQLAGGQVIDGLVMLAAQGQQQVQLMTGAWVPLDVLLRALGAPRPLH